MKMVRHLTTAALLVLLGVSSLPGEPPRLQVDHQGPITAVAWSADGQQIVTASQGDVIRVLATSTGKELHRFASGHAVRGIAISADGKMLALSQDGHGSSFWKIANGQRQQSNNYTNYAPEHLAFTPDGQTVMGCDPGQFIKWKMNGGITTSGGKGGACAAVSPDAVLGACGDGPGLLRI